MNVFTTQSYSTIHFFDNQKIIKTPTYDVLNTWIKDNIFSLDGSKTF